MGQFDSIGLKPVGEIGLTKPQNRSIGASYTEDKPKPKPKPKAAAAGGGSNPPNKPPKGPTGGKNPGTGKDDEYKRTKADKVIKKGKIKYDDRENPRNSFKNKW